MKCPSQVCRLTPFITGASAREVQHKRRNILVGFTDESPIMPAKAPVGTVMNAPRDMNSAVPTDAFMPPTDGQEPNWQAAIVSAGS
jgi:hypothetical protein